MPRGAESAAPSNRREMILKIAVESASSAPADIVYATNIDIARWPQFVRGIESVEILTGGPIRAGTKFRETRVMFGKHASEDMTISELSPPHRQVFTAENHGTRYTATTELISQGTGTLIRMTFEGVPVTLLARLMSVLAALMAGRVRKQLQADIDDVAAEATRRATS